ncbi:MAG TPA: 50S ribosomal protein L9, partial [Candidatus Moranbacteria bacterium]|nr:50S ribosomal protein L9 [Candidatus Moranbacteria bacterium]
EVSDGYARNFLFRKKLAAAATPAEIEKHRAKLAEREAERKRLAEQAERVVKLIDGKTVTFQVKNDQGTLFAAVTPAQVAEKLSDLVGEEVPETAVRLPEAIKKIGSYEAKLDFVSAAATVRLDIRGA